jgi:hypothetical protein
VVVVSTIFPYILCLLLIEKARPKNECFVYFFVFVCLLRINKARAKDKRYI